MKKLFLVFILLVLATSGCIVQINSNYNQTFGGPYIGDIPVYPNAREINLPDALKQEISKDMGFDVSSCTIKTYFTDGKAEDVISWYSSNMNGFEKTHEEVVDSKDNPGKKEGSIFFTKEDRGVMVIAAPSTDIHLATGETLLIIGNCPASVFE